MDNLNALTVLLEENFAIAKLYNLSENYAQAKFIDDTLFIEAVDAEEAAEYVDYRKRMADRLRETIKHAKKAMKNLTKRAAAGEIDPREIPSLEDKMNSLRDYIEEAEQIVELSDDATGSFGILLMRYVKWYMKVGYLVKNFFSVVGASLSVAFGFAGTMGYASAIAGTAVTSVAGITNFMVMIIGALLGLIATIMMHLAEWGTKKESFEEIKDSSVKIISKIRTVELALSKELQKQKIYRERK